MELKELKQKYKELGDEIERLKNKKKVKTWEELGSVSGCYVTTMSDVNALEIQLTIYRKNKNIFRTKEQAEAAIAMAQLSQVMYDANDGWDPDWKMSRENKFIIYFNDEHIVSDRSHYSRYFLAFKTEEIRDEFLEVNRYLIKKAKPLL